MKLARAVSVLAVLVVGQAAVASADFRDFSNRCSPGAIRSCASLQLLTTLNAAGGTDVVIRVANMQGWGGLGDNTGGSALMRLGIVSPPISGISSGLTVNAVGAGSQTVGSPASRWSLRTPGNLGGLIELTAQQVQAAGVYGCDSPANIPGHYFRTCGGGWIEFSFSTTNAWSANNAEVAWVVGYMDIPNSDVIECDSDPNPNSATRQWCPMATVTPEPITMILLGSGLAGMGGVGFLRRRRGGDGLPPA